MWNSAKTSSFEFIDSPSRGASGEEFVIEVSRGLQSKCDLLKTWAVAGRFPDYFGGNWDAFLDCLRDFVWISEKRIIVINSDVPLPDHPEDCGTYSEILREAVNDWTSSASLSNDVVHNLTLPSHGLRVIFPISKCHAISHLLGK